jgi:hypothetical protein
MAKVIVAIEIDHNEALKIEAQAKERHLLSDMCEGETPPGYFNPNGKIALDEAMLEVDYYDDSFYNFEYRGVEFE